MSNIFDDLRKERIALYKQHRKERERKLLNPIDVLRNGAPVNHEEFCFVEYMNAIDDLESNITKKAVNQPVKQPY